MTPSVARILAGACSLLICFCHAVVAQPIIEIHPDDTAVPASGTAHFFVEADGPELVFQWRINGTNLQGANSWFLNITNITSSDAGLYSVLISNSSGSVTSAPARLVVVPTLPGMVDPSFDPGVGPDGVVRATAITPEGLIYIAGEFQNYGDTFARGVARLLENGALDSKFNTGIGADGPVYTALLQPDGQLVLGGAFTTFNGIPAPNIVRLTTNGAVDSMFNTGSGPSAAVWTIAAQTNGALIIGGQFTSVAGYERTGLARLHTNGAVDLAYAPQLGGSVRRVIILSDGSALVGGSFYFEQALAGNNFTRVTDTGMIDPTFNIGYGPNSWVMAIADAGAGKSYIGGSFNAVNGNFRPGLARMTSSGALDLTFEPAGQSAVAALALQSDGKLLAGGGFYGIDGPLNRSITRLLPTGKVDEIFYGWADDWVETVTVLPDQRILIAGAFNTVSDWNRPRIARIFGGNPVPFAPAFVRQPPRASSYKEGMDIVLTTKVLAFPPADYRWQLNGNDVPGATNTSLVLLNVRVPSAGNYTLIASNVLGAVTSRVSAVTISLARTNAGAVDIEFYAGSGPDSAVTTIVPLLDGKVLIAGWFSSIDGISRPRLARLNVDGSLDQTFAPSFDWFVNALVRLDSGKVLAGGSFTLVNGEPKIGLVRLMENGEADPGFHAAFTEPVNISAVAVQTNGSIIVAGYLTSMDGTVRLDLARITATGSLDTTFDVGSGVDGWISQVSIQGERIVIAGEFSRVNGVRANNIARLNSDGSVDATFETGSGASATIQALTVQTNGKIVIAGQFRSFNGVPRHQIARLNANGSLDPSFDPATGPDAEVEAVLVQQDGRIVAGGSFTRVNDRAHGRFARFNPDGSPDLTFNVGSGANASVRAIAESSPGRIFIGGSFIYVDEIPRPFIARIISADASTYAPVIVAGPENNTVSAGSDVTFLVEAAALPFPSYQWHFNGSAIPGASQWVLHLTNVEARDAGLYTVTVSNPHGTVTSPSAELVIEPPSRFAGAPDISFYVNPPPNGPVFALAVDTNDSVVIGGDFTQVGGAPLRRIARLQPNGRPDLSFSTGSGVDDTITTLALNTNGSILIGGAFKNVNGTNRSNVARLLPNGALDAAFIPPAISNAQIYALALQPDGRILIGGLFHRIGGVERLSLARLESNGSLDPTFVPALDSNTIVRALAVQPDGRIVVGGNFFILENTYHNHIIRLNSNGSIDSGYAARSTSGRVEAVDIDTATNAVIGGSFTGIDGARRESLARLNLQGVVDKTFVTTNRISGEIRALLTLPDGSVLAGGTFIAAGPHTARRLARFTPQGDFDPSFRTGSGAEGGSALIDEYGSLYDRSAVLALGLQSSGRILIGGDFMTFDTMARPYVARVFPRDAADKLSLTASGPAFDLKWDTGVLQVADEVNGPWTTVPGATSPFNVPSGGAQKFYRLKFTEQPVIGSGDPPPGE